MALNALAAKLRHFGPLPTADVEQLDELCILARPFRSKQDLLSEGDRPGSVHLLVRGWACRYKVMAGGKRQIMAYLVPGDLCDIHVFLLRQMDHSVGLLTDAQVTTIPKERMVAMLEHRPALARALWWSTLTDESVLREWIANIGQRDAFERLAHLLVELWFRLRAVGLTAANSFELPITQADLADTLGMTAVHVNRTLQRLRREGYISNVRGSIHIPDMKQLMAISRFRSNYLHLGEPSCVDGVFPKAAPPTST